MKYLLISAILLMFLWWCGRQVDTSKQIDKDSSQEISAFSGSQEQQPAQWWFWE